MLGVLKRPFASGRGEALRGIWALGARGERRGHRSGKLAEEGGQAARGRSRDSDGTQVCAGSPPGLRPTRPGLLLAPAAPASGHSPGPADSPGGDASKQGCFYLLASACGFLRHSAGTIIKLICI